jgi:hypothetical protein
MTRAQVFTLVVPKTNRAGPGHRSHLSPDGGRTTLCRVEKNAHGLSRLFPNQIPASTDVVALKAAAKQWSCRFLCSNCERKAVQP